MVLRSILIALSLLVALPVVAKKKEDPKVKVARSHNELGNKYFADEDYEKAIEEYKAALEYIDHEGLLTNISLAYLKIGDVVQAKQWYETLAEKHPEVMDTDMVEKLGAMIDEAFAKTMAELSLTGLPEGASVSLDGEPLADGPGPGFDATVPAKEHTIEVTHPDYEPFSLTVTALAGKDMVVPIAMKTKPATGFLSISGGEGVASVDGKEVGAVPLVKHPLPVGPHQVTIVAQGGKTHAAQVTITKGAVAKIQVPASSVATPGPKAGSSSSMRTWGYLTMAIGGAVLIGGGVMTYLALDDAEESNDVFYSDPTESDSLWDDAEGKLIGSYVLYGVGGAAIAGGLLMTLLADDGPGQASAGPVSFGLVPMTGGVTLTTAGSF